MPESFGLWLTQAFGPGGAVIIAALMITVGVLWRRANHLNDKLIEELRERNKDTSAHAQQLYETLSRIQELARAVEGRR